MNRDLVNRPVQSILQLMSGLAILLKVACDRIPMGTSFLLNANFYNSCRI